MDRHEVANIILGHKNWTGLTIAQLIEAGRITNRDVIKNQAHRIITAKTIGEHHVIEQAIGMIAKTYKLY
jgi:hypothetical protein